MPPEPANNKLRCVLVLSLAFFHYLQPDDRLNYLLNLFHNNNVEVIEARNSESAAHFLTGPFKPQAVIIRDEGILDTRHTEVLEWLLSYVRKGGRAIFCSKFINANTDDMHSFFKNHLQVPWKEDVGPTAMGCQIFASPFFSHGRDITGYIKLADSFAVGKSLGRITYFLDEVDQSDSMYVSAGFWSPPLAPVAFKPLEQGWIGFVGLDDGGEDEKYVDHVIYCMCGIPKP